MPAVTYGDGFRLSADSVVRPVHLQLVSLWHFQPSGSEGGVWQTEALAATPTVEVSQQRSPDLNDAAGRPLPVGLYYALANVDGHLECLTASVGRGGCMDVMIGSAPAGMVASCVRLGDGVARAMFIRDPASLAGPACASSSYLASITPTKDGKPDGMAMRFLEDGRLVATTPYVDGLREGLGVEYRNTFEGGPLHVERRFLRGVQQGPTRVYDNQGRLATENGIDERTGDGVVRTYWASGHVAEQTVWKHRRVLSIRTSDEKGHVTAKRDYGPEGAAHGNFCSPTHQCGAW